MSVQDILSAAFIRQGQLQQRAMDTTSKISLATMEVAKTNTMEAIRIGDEVRAEITALKENENDELRTY